MTIRVVLPGSVTRYGIGWIAVWLDGSRVGVARVGAPAQFHGNGRRQALTVGSETWQTRPLIVVDPGPDRYISATVRKRPLRSMHLELL